MLLPFALSAQSFRYDNWGVNPSATPGTSIVPGTASEGAWTEVASTSDVAQDVYLIHVMVHNGTSAGVNRALLLDIGVDPAGGTSYSGIIENITCGGSSVLTVTVGNSGFRFVFPYYIKAGSSVALRGQSAVANSFRAGITLHGQPSRPESFPVGRFSETIGTVSQPNGVSFTPGNAADGTWVSLGTTAKAMWWWQLAAQLSAGNITQQFTYVELAAGDATNKQILIRQLIAFNTSESAGVAYSGNENFGACFFPLPAGTELWIRGRCDSAPTAGYNGVAIGIGG